MIKSGVRQSAAEMVAEVELSFFKTAESISQSETRTTFYTSAFLPTDQIQVEIPNGSPPALVRKKRETRPIRLDTIYDRKKYDKGKKGKYRVFLGFPDAWAAAWAGAAHHGFCVSPLLPCKTVQEIRQHSALPAGTPYLLGS